MNLNIKSLQFIGYFIAVFIQQPPNLAAQTCLPAGIEFSNQSQIDLFPINHPTCTEIQGTVGITGNSITNLAGLAQITKIHGNLNVFNTTLLSDFEGLNNLSLIGGNFSFTYNNLLDFNGLDNLTTINGNFVVNGDQLTTLSNFAGLESLNTIGGATQIVFIPLLTNFNGLNNLNTIGMGLGTGGLSVSLCPSLSNFMGLDNLTQVKRLSIVSNTSLQDFAGLNNLQLIDGDFTVSNNNGIVSLNGLSSLNTISGHLNIEGNNSLTSLAGMPNVSYVPYFLEINNNDMLQNLNGLENIMTLGNSLNIRRNDLLSDLSGLSNLASVNGPIYVENNPTLPSLSGLDNVAASFTNLIVQNNLSLSDCAVQSVCDYLSTPSNPATIQLNASGCANRVEVETNCLLLPVELVRFTGKRMPNGVALTWETQNELEILGHEVQKSGDGATWAALKLVNSQPATGGVSVYHFDDDSPFPGTNYYRLKHLGQDGSFEYSNIISITAGQTTPLKIYPNPTGGGLHTVGMDSGSYELRDCYGRTVSIGNFENATMAFDHLTQGVYLLILEAAGSVEKFPTLLVKE
jgi:hypothetical protein